MNASLKMLVSMVLVAFVAGSCSDSTGGVASSGGQQQRQEPLRPQTLLETLLRRREEAGGIFICNCKDLKYSETPQLVAVTEELTKQGIPFKQPHYKKYTYYLNRLIPLVRRSGKVWVAWNHRLKELNDLLHREFFDKHVIEFQQEFPSGTLALVANSFASADRQDYSFEPCAKGGEIATNVVFTPKGDYVMFSSKSGRIRWSEFANPKHAGSALVMPRAKKGQAGCFSGGESGLVGMALHPDCANNNRVFLHYNWQYENGKRHAIISEWRLDLSDLPHKLLLKDERQLLLIEQPRDTHNAGQLVFGPDGYLYIAIGDGHDGKVRERSPAHNLRGKVLRIDVDKKDKGLEYAIPPDNPYVGVEGFRPETWAWGFRNPWRLSFLPDGRLIAGDIGEDVNEELTFVVKGRHHGWPFTEGDHKRFEFTPEAEQQPALLPYDRSVGMSVVAGCIYQGDALPELRGKFIFCDYLSGFIWSLDVPDGTDATLTIEDADVVTQWPLMMPTIVEGPDRELYFGAHDGRVLKFVRGTGEPRAGSVTEVRKADPGTARGSFGSDFTGTAGPASTAQQAALGKRLFFEPLLSADGKTSCATCHDVARYGQDGGMHASAAGGPKRNTPSIFNIARQFAQFCDYRAISVEDAVRESLKSHMGLGSGDIAAEKLAANEKFVADFAKAFDGQKPNADNIAHAIGAHLRQLRTTSRWEQFLDGDDKALSDEELIGLNEFMMAGCTTCHLYRGLGGHMHQKLGLLQPWTGVDKGRGAIDPDSGQDYFFKVATLFNIEKTAPYYHDGSQKTLSDAVRHMAKSQVNRDLSDTQVNAIVVFLKSLTGEIPEAAGK